MVLYTKQQVKRRREGEVDWNCHQALWSNEK